MRLAIHDKQFLVALAALAMSGCVAVGFKTVTVSGPSLSGPRPAQVATTQPGTPPGLLSGADICARIPPDLVGQAIGGRVMSASPLPDSPVFGAGCQFIIEPGTDGKGIYVNLFAAPEASFERIRSISGEVTPVDSLGDDAYTATRPDGPELWALVKGRGAAGVAIGGAWSVNRARLLASYVIALIDG